MATFNGKTFFVKEVVFDTVHLDACLTGMGAIIKNDVYHTKTPATLKNQNIAVLEMFNILVTITVWKNIWVILNTGKTKDPMLATISRNILSLWLILIFPFMLCMLNEKKNVIADLLSRWQASDTQTAKLHNLVPDEWLLIESQHLELDYEI